MSCELGLAEKKKKKKKNRITRITAETWLHTNHYSGEGIDNPLQCSCLGNPTDRGAWNTTVHGVARVRHNLATKPLPPEGLPKCWIKSQECFMFEENRLDQRHEPRVHRADSFLMDSCLDRKLTFSVVWPHLLNFSSSVILIFVCLSLSKRRPSFTPPQIFDLLQA